MTFLSTLALLLAAGAPTIASAQSTTTQPSFFLQDPSDGKPSALSTKTGHTQPSLLVARLPGCAHKLLRCCACGVHKSAGPGACVHVEFAVAQLSLAHRARCLVCHLRSCFLCGVWASGTSAARLCSSADRALLRHLRAPPVNVEVYSRCGGRRPHALIIS